MLIEIRRAGFVNKGAELMLRAILSRLKETFPDANFAFAQSTYEAPFQKRMELGLYQKIHFWKFGRSWNSVAKLVPKRIRDALGLIIDSELDVVLDAAGFAYSDQWGVDNTVEMADYCKRQKKNGVKVILLPQAFGPFNLTENRKAIIQIVENADLVFAREKVSYDYIVDIVGPRDNLKISPDFTNLISGEIPENFDAENNRFCIIPNYRMVDKTSIEESKAYLPFLITCAQYLLSNGAKPFILVHEGDKDYKLALEINKACNNVIPIVKETDALKIKGILGVCEGTIGSRFHGLVSALSQGVPSLATGWSHKYQMLFDDYGFPEGLINVLGSAEEIKTKLDLLLNTDSREKIKAAIEVNGSELKSKSNKMWQEVISKIQG